MSTTTKNALSVKEVKEMAAAQPVKETLTSEDLFKLVNEKFNLVATKSAMLKLLRSEGYSVAQNRCYNAYLQINKRIEDQKKAIGKTIVAKAK